MSARKHSPAIEEHVAQLARGADPIETLERIGEAIEPHCPPRLLLCLADSDPNVRAAAERASNRVLSRLPADGWIELSHEAQALSCGSKIPNAASASW